MVGCQVSVTKKKAKMEKMEEKRRLLQVESQEGRVELPALNSSGSVSRSSVALEAKPTRSLQFCRRFLRHAEQLEFDCHQHQQSGAEARPLPRRFLRLAARRQNLPLRKTLVCVCLIFFVLFFYNLHFAARHTRVPVGSEDFCLCSLCVFFFSSDVLADEVLW